MLADGPATEHAATGPDGLLAAGPGMIWVQMATAGIEWTARLARTADVPVSWLGPAGHGTGDESRAVR